MLLFGLLIFCLIVISLSTNEHYGLDDWKQENIEKYIEDNTGIDIDPNTLTALGLHDGGDFVEKMSSDSVNTLIKVQFNLLIVNYSNIYIDYNLGSKKKRKAIISLW